MMTLVFRQLCQNEYNTWQIECDPVIKIYFCSLYSYRSHSKHNSRFIGIGIFS